MKPRILYSAMIAFFAFVLILGCTPKTPTPVPVDVVGTRAAELAAAMLTQTVAAYSPTPLPPTITFTPTPEPVMPTETVFEATKRPEVIGSSPLGQAACWTGPGSSYTLVSNISGTKRVDLLGKGSVEGWYIIRNPYFNVPCWISAADLQIFSDIDLSVYPVMTPAYK